MPTTTPRTPKRAAPAAACPLPYPELGDSEGKLFWLAAYFIGLSKSETISHVCDEMYRRRRGGMVTVSLLSGHSALRNEANKALRHAVKAGLLPFAHPATTVFNSSAGVLA